MSYDHRLIPIAQGQVLSALPSSLLSALQLNGGLTGINSVTVYNNSPLTVTLYRGMDTPMGSGVPIGPYMLVTVPASNVKKVAIGLTGNATQPGTIDLQWTDENLVALSSGVAPPSPLPSGAIPFAVPVTAAFTSGNLTTTTNLVNAQVGQVLYITSIQLFGVAMQALISYVEIDDAGGSALFGIKFPANGDGVDPSVSPGSPLVGAAVGQSGMATVHFDIADTPVVGQVNALCVVAGYFV